VPSAIILNGDVFLHDRAARARVVVHVLLATLIVAASIFQGHDRLVAAAGVEALVLGLSWPALRSRSSRLHLLLCLDAAAALALWWLFGPVAGLGIVLFLVVAISGIVHADARHAVVVACALGAEAAQIPLHFVALRLDGLPLFHPPGQVTSASEFLAGSGIRLVALGLTAVLFARIGRAIREYKERIEQSEAEQRQAAERLRDLVRSKDQFVASISHEIRTPLTAVVGFAEVLREAGAEMGRDETSQLIDDIAQQSREVASIVEDLLVIARADVGGLAIRPEPASLRALAEGVAASVDLGEKSLTVRGADVTVQVDPFRLRQILRNLITNAVRYGGDRIRIEWHPPAGGLYRMAVIDDGPGLGKQDEERVFEVYQRAHDTPTQPASVGLGLAVSRSLAQAMGGGVEYSRVGSLTAFVVTLAECGVAERDVETVRSSETAAA
jgi:signal transduction histidine kinase